jgi:hypothetical protein
LRASRTWWVTASTLQDAGPRSLGCWAKTASGLRPPFLHHSTAAIRTHLPPSSRAAHKRRCSTAGAGTSLLAKKDEVAGSALHSSQRLVAAAAAAAATATSLQVGRNRRQEKPLAALRAKRAWGCCPSGHGDSATLGTGLPVSLLPPSPVPLAKGRRPNSGQGGPAGFLMKLRTTTPFCTEPPLLCPCKNNKTLAGCPPDSRKLLYLCISS